MNRIAALLLYAVIAAGIVGSDLWTKHLVFDMLGVHVVQSDGRAELAPAGQHQHDLIQGNLAFEAVLNFGAFNGMFRNIPWLLVAVSGIAVLVTALLVGVPPRAPPLLVVALALLAGGALGNLHDRLEYGAVRDFIKVYYHSWVWPNFNLADSAICVGVGLLLLREVIVAHRKRSAGEEPDAEEMEAAAHRESLRG